MRLLGHFRHEVGHFYWEVLVEAGGRLADFADVFGDPEQDYAEALKAHYRDGAPKGWEAHFVSAYATSHPWEDFAETWAHYLHMVDGLETAAEYGIAPKINPYGKGPVQGLLDAWIPVSVAMNSMNRAMGQADFYPFVLAGPVQAKLGFIHGLLHPG